MGTWLIVSALLTYLTTVHGGVPVKRDLLDGSGHSSVGEITQAIPVPFSRSPGSHHDSGGDLSDLHPPSLHSSAISYSPPAIHHTPSPTPDFEHSNHVTALHAAEGHGYASTYDYSHSYADDYVGQYVPSWEGGLDGGVHSHYEPPHVLWESELEGSYVPSWLGGLSGSHHSDNTIDDNISEDSYTAGVQRSHGDSGYGLGTGFYG